MELLAAIWRSLCKTGLKLIGAQNVVPLSPLDSVQASAAEAPGTIPPATVRA